MNKNYMGKSGWCESRTASWAFKDTVGTLQEGRQLCTEALLFHLGGKSILQHIQELAFPF